MFDLQALTWGCQIRHLQAKILVSYPVFPSRCGHHYPKSSSQWEQETLVLRSSGIQGDQVALVKWTLRLVVLTKYFPEAAEEVQDWSDHLKRASI